MKALERPSGYFQYFDPINGQVQGETRQCVHCGYTWVYDPGLSMRRKLGLTTKQPTIRGTCLKCYGLVCARSECQKRGCIPIEKQIDNIEQQSKILVA